MRKNLINELANRQAPGNRLDLQARRAATTDSNIVANVRLDVRDDLLAEVAAQNSLVIYKYDFFLEELAQGELAEDISRYSDTYAALDHICSFLKDGRPAAMSIEPYSNGDVRQLFDHLDEIGLVAHQPPNVRASFWYPGSTHFIVLTRPDFGSFRWLDEQLEFRSDL